MGYWEPLGNDGRGGRGGGVLVVKTGISRSSGAVATTGGGGERGDPASKQRLGLQQVERRRCSLVRRLHEAQRIFGAAYAEPDLLWQHVHFDATETSQAAGAAFLKRFRLRRENRDPEVNEKVAPAQSEALSKWGAPREKPYEYLNAIRQPTLVINGDHDVIVYTINSYILQQNIPNAQLILYPDASHGALYQYPERFVRHVSMFLSE